MRFLPTTGEIHRPEMALKRLAIRATRLDNLAWCNRGVKILARVASTDLLSATLQVDKQTLLLARLIFSVR